MIFIPSGVPMDRTYPLFQFRHGDHICVFYDSEDYLLQTLTPFVAEGLRRRERCFIVQTESVVRRLAFDLEFIGIDLGRELEGGAIEVHTPHQVYLSSGVFEPHKLMDMLL